MKISQKLIFFFLLTSLIPLLVGEIFSYINTQRSLGLQIHTQITNTAARQEAQIETLLNDEAATDRNFPQGIQIMIMLEAYFEHPAAANQAKVQQAVMDAYILNNNYRRIHVLNLDGTVIGSSDPAFVGRSYKNTSVFKHVGPAPYAAEFFIDVDGRLGHYLINTLRRGDKPVGYGLVEAPVENYLLVTGDYSDLGKTGETLLLRRLDDGTVQYLTPGRFGNNLALATYSTPAGHPDEDYRGHKVLRVRRDVAGTPWTVEVKMDQAEIYKPVTDLRDLAIVIVLVTGVVVTVLGLFFAGRITGPIQRFTAIVKRIQGGETSLKVAAESKDEIGTLGTAFNAMTEQMLESRARLESSVLGLSQGFIIADTSGRVVMINPAARQLLKVPAGSAPGALTLTELFADMENFTVGDQMKACLAKQAPVEVRDVAAPNAFFNFYFTPIMINQEAHGMVILVSDETQEKALQRSRDEFFSIASHELRTPLTAISGNASLIKLLRADKLKGDAEMVQMVDDIEYSSDRLIGIVNDFLDASSLELGKISYRNQVFDLIVLTNDVVKDFKAANSLHGLDLAVELPATPLPEAYGDIDRVRQVLTNLVSNGLKFTQKGSVKISFKQEGPAIVTSVQDTGGGISPENQKLLFHKFQQASASILTRDTAKGTGLGLYISKLIVEGMGGRIQLSSTEVNKGSTFTFSLPVATAEQIRSAQLGEPKNQTAANPSAPVTPPPSSDGKRLASKTVRPPKTP